MDIDIVIVTVIGTVIDTDIDIAIHLCGWNMIEVFQI